MQSATASSAICVVDSFAAASVVTEGARGRRQRGPAPAAGPICDLDELGDELNPPWSTERENEGSKGCEGQHRTCICKRQQQRGRRRSAPAPGPPQVCSALSAVYAASIGALRRELKQELVHEALQEVLPVPQNLPAAPTREAASIARHAHTLLRHHSSSHSPPAVTVNLGRVRI